MIHTFPNDSSRSPLDEKQTRSTSREGIEKDFEDQFKQKYALIETSFWKDIALLAKEGRNELDKEVQSPRRMYLKEFFLQLPVDEQFFHYLCRIKTKHLDDEFGQGVSVAFLKAWGAINMIDNKNDRLDLRKKLLNLSFYKNEYSYVGLRGIPWFDRPEKVFSMWWIHPSMLFRQFSEETKNQNKSSLLEKFKSIIVRNLINHELWEKEGGASALKKYNINETYKNESLLIPKTHAIHNFTEKQLKEFFMTIDEARALEERAWYNIDLLVELLKINMVYDGSVDNPNKQYSHVLLADKDQFSDSVIAWKITKIKHTDAKDEYHYASHIKKANPKKPMLLYGFVNEKPTIANTTQKTTSKLAENLDK